MSRVNLDFNLWADPRVLVLADSMSISKDETIGKLAYLWYICTANLRYEMSHKELNLLFDGFPNFAELLVEARLGYETKNNFVRIAGAEERIEWLRKLKDNAKEGGRKSGQSRRKSLEASVQKVSPSVRSNSNPPTPALSPAPAPAHTPPPKGGGEGTPPPQGKELLEFWSQKVEEKYGTKPLKRSEEHLNISLAILDKCEGSLTKAKSVLSAYFEDGRQFYVERAHEIGLVLRDIDKLWARACARERIENQDVPF